MSPQQSIGHYRIVSKLGEGGMGAVYRATDTKLNRDVAIKVLPPAFAEDAGRMQRFEREAQVLASLNHPNIAAIYGVEQGAIVMELIDGANPRGPLPADTVIDYARQIASGLEAAHEKGIVHRDLKPDNIKVTPEGVVKLLDFGLAKAREESSSTSTASPTISPTLSLAMTQAGMILGTAAYMSPEQARGKAVDRRADIWAYGVILFELLTGRHPYGTGETVTDTLAAIVLKDPEFAALPSDTPVRLRRLIERCLRKDPKTRLRDIGDARMLLDEPDAEPAAAPAAPISKRWWLPWTLAAAGLAIAATVAGVAWLRPSAADPGPGTVRFTVPFPPDTEWPNNNAGTQWVPSPDGRNIAMIVSEKSGQALWVRPANATAAHRLDKTEGALLPFWSPDGQSIAFFVDDKLKRVALTGGAVQKVADLPGSNPVGDGGTWGNDGSIIFGIARQASPLLRVPATGGEPVPVTTLGKDETGHAWPQLLPDGIHVSYMAKTTGGTNAIYVQELGSSKRVHVMNNATRAEWSPPGYLLFVREGSLFAQRMNSRSFHLEGEPLLIAEEVASNESNGRSTFSVSQNGVLVYRGGGIRTTDKQISWRDRTGKVLQALGKPGHFGPAVLSPDAKSAAVFLTEGSRTDLWVMDTATGVLAPLTHNGAVLSGPTNPVWSPDSKRLVMLGTDGLKEITVASGAMSLVTKERLAPEDWSPDGRSILCRNFDSAQFVLVLPEEGGRVQPVITTPHRQSQARISPDGKYVAYYSNEVSGRGEIFVASFPSFSVKRRVSEDGGTFPVWSDNGKSLFYRAASGDITEVAVRTGSTIEIGERKTLFKYGRNGGANHFGVAPGAQRFLINESGQLQAASEALELQVVMNWAAGLGK